MNSLLCIAMSSTLKMSYLEFICGRGFRVGNAVIWSRAWSYREVRHNYMECPTPNIHFISGAQLCIKSYSG